MAVENITQTLPSAASAPASSAPAVGREAFMQLLVAQMKAQDPLDPMDSRDFITQLSQLTGVEQLTTVADRVASLEIATAGMANTQVASLVGKTVTADASSLRIEEMGQASSSYTLTSEAAATTITIKDPSGHVVRTMELGPGAAGAHAVTWDGNDDAGNRLPAGRYTYEVSAKNAAGNPVAAETKVTGIVSGITYEHGYPELMVGDTQVLLGDVVSISM